MFSQHRLDEALAHDRRAIELDADDTQMLAGRYVNLGQVLQQQNKLDEAVDAFHRAVAISPNYAMAHFYLGIALSNQKKSKEAVEALRKAVEFAPTWAMAHAGLGGLLCELNEYEKGADALRKAIEFNPNNPVYYSNLGLALVRQRKLDDAIVAYRKAIEIDPNPQAAAVHSFSLAKVLEDQGKLDETIASFRKAAELDPSFALAHSCLAWLLTNCKDAKLRDPSEGMEVARKAIEMGRDSSLAWQVLGWAHYRRGDWRASIEALEKSCALDDAPKGGNAFQWFFVAMAHWQLGEREKAREWYDKAAEWMEANAKDSADLIRFRTEAEELMRKESGVSSQEQKPLPPDN